MTECKTSDGKSSKRSSQLSALPPPHLLLCLLCHSVFSATASGWIIQSKLFQVLWKETFIGPMKCPIQYAADECNPLRVCAPFSNPVDFSISRLMLTSWILCSKCKSRYVHSLDQTWINLEFESDFRSKFEQSSDQSSHESSTYSITISKLQTSAIERVHIRTQDC
jgi:hypothetical protein